MLNCLIMKDLFTDMRASSSLSDRHDQGKIASISVSDRHDRDAVYGSSILVANISDGAIARFREKGNRVTRNNDDVFLIEFIKK